ncbi:hypothetical protein MASR2M48_06630 [Spirochaetota bacterium]
MALTVGARKNTLTGKNKEFRFHASCSGSVEKDEFIEIMSRENSALGRKELEAALALIGRTLARLVADGNSVRTPIGAFYLSAVGLADKESSPFTPRDEASGHGFRLRFRPDRSFEAQVTERVSVNRDDSSWQLFPRPASLLSEVGKRNAGFKPGLMVRLAGDYLGFDEDEKNQGVFFVKSIADSGMRAENYALIKPKRIIFTIPDELEPGEYTVLLRSSTKAGTLRSGYLDGKITIA